MQEPVCLCIIGTNVKTEVIYCCTAEYRDAQLTGLLVKYFFKDWQLTVIKATVDGKNSLTVQPTGSGSVSAPGLVTERSWSFSFQL